MFLRTTSLVSDTH
ncbi:hypothetical protein LINGRAHAP2_LOCUS21992 [Linum grandiflorum]